MTNRSYLFYYIQILTNEIENSNTFTDTNVSKADILNKLSKSGYIRLADEQSLPDLYCTVKMHKDPVSFRFITATTDTITQNLSISVSKCLKLLLKTAQNSEGYKIKHLEDCILIIDNRNRVLNFINKANAQGQPNTKKAGYGMGL